MNAQSQAAARTHREPICEAVVDAVADAEDVDPRDLRPTLYEVIDPDALEALFADSDRAAGSELSVTFRYGDWSVCVHGDGDVTVVEPPTDAARPKQPVSHR